MIKEAKKLKILNSKYESFANHIQELADDLEFDELGEFLSKYI